jgi:hypothetical protein
MCIPCRTIALRIEQRKPQQSREKTSQVSLPRDTAFGQQATIGEQNIDRQPDHQERDGSPVGKQPHQWFWWQLAHIPHHRGSQAAAVCKDQPHCNGHLTGNRTGRPNQYQAFTPGKGKREARRYGSRQRAEQQQTAPP